MVKKINQNILTSTGTDEKAISKPGLEEPVFFCFVDMNVAAKNKLDIPRVIQEHEEPGSNPNSNGCLIFKFEAPLHYIFKYFCE